MQRRLGGILHGKKLLPLSAVGRGKEAAVMCDSRCSFLAVASLMPR